MAVSTSEVRRRAQNIATDLNLDVVIYWIDQTVNCIFVFQTNQQLSQYALHNSQDQRRVTELLTSQGIAARHQNLVANIIDNAAKSSQAMVTPFC